jgi:hypothetical protein
MQHGTRHPHTASITRLAGWEATRCGLGVKVHPTPFLAGSTGLLGAPICAHTSSHFNCFELTATLTTFVGTLAAQSTSHMGHLLPKARATWDTCCPKHEPHGSPQCAMDSLTLNCFELTATLTTFVGTLAAQSTSHMGARSVPWIASLQHSLLLSGHLLPKARATREPAVCHG